MKLVLVDFSHFASVCWFPALSAQEADPKYDAKLVLKTNIEGKVATLRDELFDAGEAKPLFIWVEDRHAKRKYEVFPGYKGNREKRDFDPRPLAKQYLKELGYRHFCYSPDNEADDAIATLAVTATQEVVIASGDKDLWQLWNPPKVEIYRTGNGKWVDQEMIEKEFGVTNPKHIALYKALWGDSGDSIPNAVPRMQKQLLPLIKASDASLNGFFAQCQFAKLTDRCRELLHTGNEQIKVNDQLARLDTNCPIVWDRQ